MKSLLKKIIYCIFTVIIIISVTTLASCKPRQARIISKIIHDVEHAEEHSESAEGFNISVNGTTISTTTHDWVTMSVQGNSTYTIVVKQCYPKSAPTWICSSGSEFIEDCDTGQRYYLTGSDIGVRYDNRTDLLNTNPISFNEYYPSLPNTVVRINISSGSRYYVTNVKIR